MRTSGRRNTDADSLAKLITASDEILADLRKTVQDLTNILESGDSSKP